MQIDQSNLFVHCELATCTLPIFIVHILQGYFLMSILLHHYSPRNEVAEGIMFLTRPSVSPSVSQSVAVSPVLFVSATPLKPLNRISWNFVVIKDIMCTYAYPQEILIQFFSQSNAHFELRNLAKMKDTTWTICQRNSSETAQQNFVKLCSCEGHNMLMCIPTGNFVQFFSQNYALFLNLEIWPKWKILLKQFVSATPLKPLNRISWNILVKKDLMCRCAYPQ